MSRGSFKLSGLCSCSSPEEPSAFPRFYPTHNGLHLPASDMLWSVSCPTTKDSNGGPVMMMGEAGLASLPASGRSGRP